MSSRRNRKDSQSGNVLLRYVLPIGIFLLLIVVFLFISPRSGQRMQSAFLQVVMPFFKTGTNVRSGIQNVTSGLQSLEQLEGEVDKLRVENKELRAESQLYRDMAEENNQLRRSLDFQQRSSYRLLSAQVIRGSDAGSWSSTVQVDRGAADGVINEMPVLTDRGLVGKIVRVAENTSTVLLLVDETCRVAAMVEDSKDQGILGASRTSSTTMPELTLRLLPKSAEVRQGQRVLSSGAGTVFPPGITLGFVDRFTVKELDSEAVVRPAVDFSALSDVFIVVGRK